MRLKVKIYNYHIGREFSTTKNLLMKIPYRLQVNTDYLMRFREIPVIGGKEGGGETIA
jgi:hypothetical protein